MQRKRVKRKSQWGMGLSPVLALVFVSKRILYPAFFMDQLRMSAFTKYFTDRDKRLQRLGVGKGPAVPAHGAASSSMKFQQQSAPRAHASRRQRKFSKNSAAAATARITPHFLNKKLDSTGALIAK